MTLSKEDGQLYYKLWLPLLDFVNRKYRVKHHFRMERKSVSTADTIEVDKSFADYVWKQK